MNFSALFPDDDYRFHMGLQRGDAREFFAATPSHGAILEERQRWLDHEPDKHVAWLPEGDALLNELCELAATWLGPAENERLMRSATGRERCMALGRMLEPDFLLLKTDANQDVRLLGGCVCFPSAWSLSEKLGRPMDFIHGVVPGFNHALGRKVNPFLAGMRPDTTWLRHNWGLSTSAERNQHPDRALPRLAGVTTLDAVWLRVERQALVPLPASRGILFGIRVESISLAEVRSDRLAVERLSRALRTMPAEVAAYKNIASARESIVELLGREL